MISWISTVGWSPFAVINPLWAYSKEFEDLPERVHLIYTTERRIEKNLEKCKIFIKEIITTYSGREFNESNIFQYPLKNENVESYADTLKIIIKKEGELNPTKVVLDMTPGRKYMSAINVYFGLFEPKIPIQVIYLHLEEFKYQDNPLPLTPIIKNELIDIIDSTSVFSRETVFNTPQDIDDDTTIKISENVTIKVKETEKLKEFLILMAISEDFLSLTQIRKFLYNNKISTQGNELRQMLKKLLIDKFAIKKMLKNESTGYTGYKLTENGKKELERLKTNLLQILEEK